MSKTIALSVILCKVMTMRRAGLLLGFALTIRAATVSKVWVADRGDGTYKNPILHADYSDPDVIRIGNDFYMTASSFNAVPGLPILHSKDLVNFPAPGLDFLRLYAIPPPDAFHNLWEVPNLLLQKFPAPEFTVTAKLTFTGRVNQDRTGLIIMGSDYAYIGLQKTGDAVRVSQVVCKDADRGAAERQAAPAELHAGTVYLRVSASAHAVSHFSYSTDGAKFIPMGEPFPARAGRWIGAKAGLFALGTVAAPEYGYADYDWFRVE